MAPARKAASEKKPAAKKAAPKKPAAKKTTAPKLASRAAPKAANITVEPLAEAIFEVRPDSFTNNSEWPLYHLNEYVRAKQVIEPCYVPDADKHAVPGDYVVVNEDHQVKVLGEESFEKTHVIIKGPHKRDF